MRRLVPALLLALGSVSLVLAPGCGEGRQPDPTPPTEEHGPLGPRDDLPVDERLSLEGLDGPVNVVRDDLGRTHIYASTLHDAMYAEGYLVARDRGIQMELLRRISQGRMADLLGDVDESLLGTDVTFRTLGLARVAEAQYAALPEGDELRVVLDAFSAGVSKTFADIRSGALLFPQGVVGLDRDKFTDWTPAASLAIGRLQTYLLSYSGSEEADATVTFEAFKTAFEPSSAEPAVALRDGIERDVFRFAPATQATTTTGYPMSTGAFVVPPKSSPLGPRPKAMQHVRHLTETFVRAQRKAQDLIAPEGFGSNNWAIHASRSASGRALLASDPHLSLSAPSVFWPVSIEVRKTFGQVSAGDLKVGGISFPGIPGIILGHNEHVAWGATVAGYDVTDLYAEELTADGEAVVFQGQEVPLETVVEEIARAGKPPISYEIKVVPHHGPLMPVLDGDFVPQPPDPALGAISIKWTGFEVTNELRAVMGLHRATTVDEAREALFDFGVGAQNWMLADVHGDIAWSSHCNLPLRDQGAFSWDAATYEGTLPVFVLPGDGSAEWTGYLDSNLVPTEKNPPEGYLATANNDPIGDTLDNDPSNDTLPDGTPMFIGASFDIGFRQERIRSVLSENAAPLTVEDLQALQADHRSPLGARLVPILLEALERGITATPGDDPDLAVVLDDAAWSDASIEEAHDLLLAWQMAGYPAAAGVDLDTDASLDGASGEGQHARATLLFNAWLVRFVKRVLADEYAQAGYSTLGRSEDVKALLHLCESDPAVLATYDPATQDSALWDDLGTPDVIESRHDRMLRAMLDALALTADLGADARWGNIHRVRFAALVPLFSSLSIPPSDDPVFPDGFPRHGDLFNVDNCDYGINVDVTSVPSFDYSHGPTQRFTIEMDPAGPKAFNALPGGAVWDAASPHHRDLAELWRKNQVSPVPFVVADVAARKEKHTVLAPPSAP